MDRHTPVNLLPWPNFIAAGNNNNLNAFNLKLTCKERFLSIKECAEQCYYREKNGVGCVGFLKYENTKECHICNPATISEVINSANTQINENDVVYILKYNKTKPVMYLPLDGGNITGGTVIGNGITGTIVNIGHTQVQAGKMNEGLHVSDGGRLILDRTANTCISDISACTDGLSIGLWVNPSSLSGVFQHISDSKNFRSLIIATDSGAIKVWTRGLVSIRSESATAGTWTHVLAVFNPNMGMFLYINGSLDAFRSIREATSNTGATDNSDYVFGAKTDTTYPFDGTLDEIKVFYSSLSSGGMFVAPERLSLRTSFYLEEEFLDTSDSLVRCVLHQNIIVFIQVLYSNVMQMSKLNSLLEATRGLDKKDTFNLTIRCVNHSD